MSTRIVFEHVVEQFTLVDGAVLSLVLMLLPVVLGLALRLRGLQHRLRERDTRIDAMARDLQATVDCSRGLGQRLREYDQQLIDLGRRQEQVELQEGRLPTAAKVMKLLQQGYSVTDIATICDLSLSEIDLISSLANYKSVA